MTHSSEPFVRVVKRTDIEKSKAILYRVIALLCALTVGGLLVALLGYSPFQMYSDMVSGAIGKSLIAVNKQGVLEFSSSAQATMKIVTLLLVTSLSGAARHWRWFLVKRAKAVASISAARMAALASPPEALTCAPTYFIKKLQLKPLGGG